MWGAVSDERSGLYFSIVAGPRQHSLLGCKSLGTQDQNCLNFLDFTNLNPRNRLAHLYPQALDLFNPMSVGITGECFRNNI
jgi:hypothetical protein